MSHHIQLLMLMLALGGCAAAYSAPPLPATHPASPEAAETPSPPPSHALAGDLLPAPAAGTTGHEGKHHGMEGGSQ